MKKGTVLLLFAVLGVLAVVYAAPDWIVDPPIHRDATTIGSDKFDGGCTGLETAGRCQDKCPPGTYLQGYQKDTGAAVCHPQTISPTAPTVYNAIEPPDTAQAEPFAGK